MRGSDEEARFAYRLDDHPGDHAAAPVVGEVWDRPGPRRLGRHSHRRGQLIHVERGAVTVEAGPVLCTVPPHRAVWVPPETPHAVRYPGPVAFRGVLIEARLCRALPARVTVVSVGPLARELIREVSRVPWDRAGAPEARRLARVLLDRLRLLPTAPLRLPPCTDERLAPVVEALRRDPLDDRPVGKWAASVALSERSLARRFRAATGLSLTQWRQQLRLAHAVERLAAGEPVTTVALDLGYGSPSGFSSMFRRTLGIPPSAYFRGEADGVQAAGDEEVG